jgi:hypothetical protein
VQVSNILKTLILITVETSQIKELANAYSGPNLVMSEISLREPPNVTLGKHTTSMKAECSQIDMVCPNCTPLVLFKTILLKEDIKTLSISTMPLIHPMIQVFK